jgi:hypothetical protein
MNHRQGSQNQMTLQFRGLARIERRQQSGLDLARPRRFGKNYQAGIRKQP